MRANRIKAVYLSEPFQPFSLCLANGRIIPVFRREYIMTTPSGRSLGVSQPDDQFDIIDVENVVDVLVAESASSTSKPSKAVGTKASQEGNAMTIQQIKKLYDAQPFRPFVIHLASGRTVDVPHREFMWAEPNGRTIFVSLPDESVDIIDLLLVANIVLMPTTNGSRKRRRRE